MNRHLRADRCDSVMQEEEIFCIRFYRFCDTFIDLIAVAKRLADIFSEKATVFDPRNLNAVSERQSNDDCFRTSNHQLHVFSTFKLEFMVNVRPVFM